jgi:2-haloacid dehalogenase
LFEAIGVSGIDGKSCNADFQIHLADGAQLIDGAADVCHRLSADRELAIITNGVERTQLNRFNKSQIKSYFKHIFVSGKIGYAKPSRYFFDYVFREMKLSEKSDVLVVGDSLTSDIQGGRDYGLDTCYYNPQHLGNDTAIIPTYEIHSLYHLL